MIRERKCLIIALIVIIAGCLVIAPTAKAAYWANLPPYNILWPLWSPILSPPDPLTGLPTPLVSSVSRSTVLPMQPALVLNPYNVVTGMGDTFPWLLYNSPGGLIFFDLIYGLNSFPPSSWVDPTTGAPIPLTLVPGYSFLPLPNFLGVEYKYFVDIANLTYLFTYGNALGVNPASLLTYASIWGLPPI